MDDLLRYPIGKFTPQEAAQTAEQLNSFIERIESLPEKVSKAAFGLSEAQLDTPYREGGWTVRQVLHHLPDSHMNAYIRFKWMLTEETPTIKAYDEKLWAETAETRATPELSITLLKALHAKWVFLLKALTEEDLKRQFFHPESRKYVRMDNLVGSYAWHGDHHLAQITSLKERKGW